MTDTGAWIGSDSTPNPFCQDLADIDELWRSRASIGAMVFSGPRVTATRVLPELSVRRGREAIDFYRRAFGATEQYRVGGTEEHPDVVAQLAIDDAAFWVSDESPEHDNFSPESVGGATTRILLITGDPEATVAHAVGAGATEVQAVTEQHGWRLGRVRDPFGHHWEIGKPLVPWPPADGRPHRHG